MKKELINKLLTWDDILNLGETVEERFNKQKLILEEIIFENKVQELKKEVYLERFCDFKGLKEFIDKIDIINIYD